MKENGRKFNLMSFALKHQKATFITALVLSSIFVFYSLVYSTSFYTISYYSNPESLMYAKGAEIYNDIQPFNKLLLDMTLIQLLFVAALFIYFCQKRRIYYLSNYITIGLYAAFSSFIAVYTIINNIIFRIAYKKVDFETVELLSELTGISYSKSTFLLDIGIVLCLCALAVAALTVVIAVAKRRARKAELAAKSTASEKIQEANANV